MTVRDLQENLKIALQKQAIKEDDEIIIYEHNDIMWLADYVESITVPTIRLDRTRVDTSKHIQIGFAELEMTDNPIGVISDV